MGEARPDVIRYLRFQEIVGINRDFILRGGGFVTGVGVPRNPDSLAYLCEIVGARLCGEELYPSLSEKGALYAFHIITRHVFWDGNKRTGMACALLFLSLNDHDLTEWISRDEIIETGVGIATKTLDLSGLTAWIEGRMTEAGLGL